LVRPTVRRRAETPWQREFRLVERPVQISLQHRLDLTAHLRHYPHTRLRQHPLEHLGHCPADQDVNVQFDQTPGDGIRVGFKERDLTSLGLHPPLDPHGGEMRRHVKDR
jgi:hypothetical protein